MRRLPAMFSCSALSSSSSSSSKHRRLSSSLLVHHRSTADALPCTLSFPSCHALLRRYQVEQQSPHTALSIILHKPKPLIHFLFSISCLCHRRSQHKLPGTIFTLTFRSFCQRAIFWQHVSALALARLSQFKRNSFACVPSISLMRLPS